MVWCRKWSICRTFCGNFTGQLGDPGNHVWVYQLGLGHQQLLSITDHRTGVSLVKFLSPAASTDMKRPSSALLVLRVIPSLYFICGDQNGARNEMLLTGLLIPFHFFSILQKGADSCTLWLYHNFKLRSYQLLFSWGLQDETPNFWYGFRVSGRWWRPWPSRHLAAAPHLPASCVVLGWTKNQATVRMEGPGRLSDDFWEEPSVDGCENPAPPKGLLKPYK